MLHNLSAVASLLALTACTLHHLVCSTLKADALWSPSALLTVFNSCTCASLCRAPQVDALMIATGICAQMTKDPAMSNTIYFVAVCCFCFVIHSMCVEDFIFSISAYGPSLPGCYPNTFVFPNIRWIFIHVCADWPCCVAPCMSSASPLALLLKRTERSTFPT